MRRLTGRITALILCSVFACSCSRDPHLTIIDKQHQENFSTLVDASKGLTSEEISLLKDAQSRIQKSHASDKIVGKTIADVIAEQRKWQADRQQLTAKLEPVYRSAKALQAATGVGVTYQKYRELLQSFATEVSVAHDKLSGDEERRVATIFESTLRAYEDAGTFWQHQIDNIRYEEMFDGEVGYSLKGGAPEPALHRLVETYNLPVHAGQFKYVQGAYQSLPKQSTQIIWAAADAKMSSAVDAYMAK